MTTTVNKTYEQVTMNNLQAMGKKAAYIAMRTISRQSGSTEMQQLELSVLAYPNSNNQDTSDIIQEAILSLIENMDNKDNFILAVKAVCNYIYRQKRRYSKPGILYIDNPETGEIENTNSGITHMLNHIEHNDIIDNIVKVLSPTQIKVLKFLAFGYSNVQISEKLNISDKTISVHVSRIREKARTLYPDFTL